MLKQAFRNTLLGYFHIQKQGTHRIPTICALNLLYMGGTSHNEEQIWGYLSDFKSFDSNLITIISPVWGGSCVSSSLWSQHLHPLLGNSTGVFCFVWFVAEWVLRETLTRTECILLQLFCFYLFDPLLIWVVSLLAPSVQLILLIAFLPNKHWRNKFASQIFIVIIFFEMCCSSERTARVMSLQWWVMCLLTLSSVFDNLWSSFQIHWSRAGFLFPTICRKWLRCQHS